MLVCFLQVLFNAATYQKEAADCCYDLIKSYLFHIDLHLREWLTILAACLPVAAAIGGLALDDDALAAKRTWFANHWVGSWSRLSRSILRICILCCCLIGFLGWSLSGSRFLGSRFLLEVFLCHDGHSPVAVV